jgi:hypothetical protein
MLKDSVEKILIVFFANQSLDREREKKIFSSYFYSDYSSNRHVIVTGGYD